MEPHEYDEIIRDLVRITMHQDTINERLTAAIERIDQTLAEVKTTQSEIKTLLAHMIDHTENGRDI